MYRDNVKLKFQYRNSLLLNDFVAIPTDRPNIWDNLRRQEPMIEKIAICFYKELKLVLQKGRKRGLI